MKSLLLAASLLAALTVGAEAAKLAKTYSYFSIGGSTLDEIENELNTRGPKVKSTGRRHPGATQMEFSTRLTYAESGGKCWVHDATVTVKAKVILPRWRGHRRAGDDVRLVWDALSSDIRRHEEQHVTIARDYARQIETTLKKLGRQKSCEVAATKAGATADKILKRHDRAQDKFDQVEAKNFEKRILRLLKARLQASAR